MAKKWWLYIVGFGVIVVVFLGVLWWRGRGGDVAQVNVPEAGNNLGVVEETGDRVLFSEEATEIKLVDMKGVVRGNVKIEEKSDGYLVGVIADLEEIENGYYEASLINGEEMMLGELGLNKGGYLLTVLVKGDNFLYDKLVVNKVVAGQKTEVLMANLK